MQHYERRLPHWDTVDQPLFVTFRWHGSPPVHRVFGSWTAARTVRCICVAGNQLHALPNHVHPLVTPKVVASRWLAPLKGFTAYRANEWLGSHGQVFWQDESYDPCQSSTAFEPIWRRTQ